MPIPDPKPSVKIGLVDRNVVPGLLWVSFEEHVLLGRITIDVQVHMCAAVLQSIPNKFITVSSLHFV